MSRHAMRMVFFLGLAFLLGGVALGQAVDSPLLRTGWIQVVCEPGVGVYLDAKPSGVATEELGGWIVQDVPPGPHVVTAVKTGFRAQELRLNVDPGAVHLFRVPPFRERATDAENDPQGPRALSQRTGILVIRTIPVECRFRIEGLGIDSEKSSTEWRNANVPAGNYDIEVAALGRILKQAVTVTEGATVEVMFNVLRGNVEVHADAREGAAAEGTEPLPLNEQIRTGEKRLAALEDELGQIRQTLQTAAADVTMERIRGLVARRDELDRQKEQFVYRLQVLKQRAELDQERLVRDRAVTQRKEFEENYAEYRQLEKDDDISAALKLGAWQQLCRKWQVEPGDQVGRLLWDEQTAHPYKVLVQTLTIAPGVDLQLVRIKAGSFRMGAEDGDDDEKPVHNVTISYTFWMGRYEVTQLQYRTIMGKNPSHFQGENRPVETVSWRDATAFCDALNEVQRRGSGLPEGCEFRLPTEAEWEYACRAGSTTAFNTGDTLDPGSANFSANQGAPAFNATKTRRETLPVGSFKANMWDLYDMHGNVWEWCLDWYDREYYGRSPLTNPFNLRPSETRICRGGSWVHLASFCRSANRNYGDPRQANHMVGFRVVLAPVPGA